MGRHRTIRHDPRLTPAFATFCWKAVRPFAARSRRRAIDYGASATFAMGGLRSVRF